MPIQTLFSRYLPTLCAALMAQAVYAQSDVEISSVDGMLSVQASNVSASELAEALSNELGINVVVTGDAETRVNLDIVEEPFEKALAKLSPNNMLVRGDNAEDIVEVVLMMGETQTGSSGGSADQFLPSGSPAEEVVTEQAQEQVQESIDPDLLRDPNRAAQVREAAGAASSDANLPAAQVPPMFADDGTPLDPMTGLPLEQ